MKKGERKASTEERMCREMLRDVGVSRELQMSHMAYGLKLKCGYLTFVFEALY